MLKFILAILILLLVYFIFGATALINSILNIFFIGFMIVLAGDLHKYSETKERIKTLVALLILAVTFFEFGVIYAYIVALILFAVLLRNRGNTPRTDVENSLLAIKKGDYTTALNRLKPLAEEGDVDAQYNLGMMYFKGDGVPKDYGKTMEWHTLAAKQGHVEAQQNLGMVCKRAAEHGHVESQYNLGKRYIKGSGLLFDPIRAYMWTCLSKANGYEKYDAKLLDTITQMMTPEDITEAKKLVREWKPKEYENG